MHERFTDNARAVMQLSNECARQLQHQYVDTEHILLALVENGAGVAVSVLKSMEIDVSQVRSIVSSIVEDGQKPIQKRRLPQTARAKKVIEYAMEEAHMLEHRYVGTEHLMLGMLRDEKTVAVAVLEQLRVNPDAFRRNTLEFLDCPDYRARNEALTPSILGLLRRWSDRNPQR